MAISRCEPSVKTKKPFQEKTRNYRFKIVLFPRYKVKNRIIIIKQICFTLDKTGLDEAEDGNEMPRKKLMASY